MLFGLAIGLSVAFAVYMKDRGVVAPPPAQPEPASLQVALDDNDQPGAETAETEPKEKRFTFYDMLPNFEVIIPEQEQDVAAESSPQATRSKCCAASAP